MPSTKVRFTPGSAWSGSVKYCLKMEPISSSRQYPDMRHIWSFTSVMKPVGIDGDQSVHRTLDEAAQIVLLLAQPLFQTDAVGDVAGGSEDAAYAAQRIAETRTR